MPFYSKVLTPRQFFLRIWNDRFWTRGIFEIFSMNEELQQMIYEDVSLVALRTKSKEMGMRTMREDGIRKVLAGITTIQEVLNVTVADSH